MVSIGKHDRAVVIWKVLPDKQFTRTKERTGGLMGALDLTEAAPSAKAAAGAKAGHKYPTKQTRK